MMFELNHHRATAPNSIARVAATLDREGDELHLTYGVEADPANLLLPLHQKPYRSDELWQSTCFELFVLSGNSSYLELNFSPSSQWAAYRFDSYRAGMQELGLDEPPSIWLTDERNGILLTATVRLRDIQKNARVGISAVIEETDGTKSYWALAHPDGPPDFHDPACFTAHLPAIASP